MHPSLAQRIEHTLLAPDAPPAAYLRLVEEAEQAELLGVCVPSRWVSRVRPWWPGLLVSVVGFPLAGVRPEVRALEAKLAIEDGADELDMVADLARLVEGANDAVQEDVERLVELGKPVKVILETGLVGRAQWTCGAKLAVRAGAAFVKTCTGFGRGRAEVEDVAELRSVVGPSMGIKASGGIRSRADAQALVAAGADRLGTSRGPELLL
ncbi:MAG: deoxyribose-phosphate aldolase [Myxococcota bacterium]